MEKNKAFMAAIPFPSPSSCLQLALFQCCYLASSLKPTNLLPKSGLSLDLGLLC